ncbi:nucleoid-associated protein [Paraflavitalea sp. CAU 1676]|uniref:nucleoid-associated protein n=1 Tax=Paraflavitalea sp. CAU 1676 TaxID=3032598 RepID=UPI0023DBCD95|nr:nucleoid-associated protein [Paraflavitalea sp. CAU 1676]MDF2192946.1 nucleoid-associated protein [Paraflavitalea sp. CAU 1676]
MTGLDDVALQKVMVHKVGNPSRGEELKLSENPLTLNDEIVQKLLTKYFLGAFNENELFHFTHLSDIELNEVYNYVRTIFDDTTTFVPQAALLAQFLYSKSTHAKVKEGELYVVLFDRVLFEKEHVRAVGIFKSETKETFLKVFQHGKSWEVIHEEGININKLDKGCLIFNTNTIDGYKVCVVDSTNKQNDTQYWVTDFLQVTPYADSYHHTDKYLSLCKSFVTNEYAEKFDVSKSDQIDMLNRSMDYFKTKEQFNLQEFAEEVIHHPEVVDTFMEYKKNFESAKNFEIEDEFDIHLSAVKKQQKVFKTVLKLDRNFHIYIHGRRDLIERGVDEMTGKKYYKIFYDEET